MLYHLHDAAGCCRSSKATMTQTTTPKQTTSMVALHMRFGWWALCLFFTLGLVLETLHGFKIEWYLGADQETRRLMWRLAHAHGALLGLLNIALAATFHTMPQAGGTLQTLISRCILTMSVLMPLGFILGGAIIHGGDPALGVMLVPVGAVIGIVGVLLLARTLTTQDTPHDTPTSNEHKP